MGRMVWDNACEVFWLESINCKVNIEVETYTTNMTGNMEIFRLECWLTPSEWTCVANIKNKGVWEHQNSFINKFRACTIDMEEIDQTLMKFWKIEEAPSSNIS